MDVITQLLRFQQDEKRRSAIQAFHERVVRRSGYFSGKNVTRFCKEYELEARYLELHLRDRLVVDAPRLVIEGQIRWSQYKMILIRMFALDDEDKVTRSTFLKWIHKPKDQSVLDIKREFDQQFADLSDYDRRAMDQEKVSLFLRAIDSKAREEIFPQLQQIGTESGLTEDWGNVDEAVRGYVEKQRTLSKFMQSWHDDLQEEQTQAVQQPVQNPQVNLPIPKDVVPTNTMEDMFKKFSDLTIQSMKQMIESQSLQAPAPKNPKAPEIKRCIWCDSLEHNRYSCESFKEALAKNLVFVKEKMIYDSKTGEKVNINFGRGGMRIFFPGTCENVASTSHTYACQVVDENNDLEPWSKVIKSLDRGKMHHEILKIASNEIRGVSGWDDPVDTLSVVTYLCSSVEHEAVVEEKRRRTNEGEEEKRRTRRQLT
ncbi:hypothetical protein KP509_30G006500 [Ceratopteris richardii]|uniref:Uncharacterized protein n=1 Tax=Ceratopteris richardii TaxID=49495 RepID=A0A8T2QZE1_CERRI|nr:hypothetical protein KP509_30G006500 [Ceratopteris richardii]